MNKNILNKDNLPHWVMGTDLKHIQEIPEIVFKKTTKKAYGFTYQIVYDDNSFYIGKKVFFNTIEIPAVSLKDTDIVIKSCFKRRIKGRGLIDYVTILRESNWKEYTGSNKTETIKIKERHILDLAYDKLHLTFLENKQLYNNLLDDYCRNKCISNTIYRDRLRQNLGLKLSEY